MTPKEIYDAIVKGGPQRAEGVRELAGLVDRLSRGPVYTSGGRRLILHDPERSAAVNDAWARIARRLARGPLSRAPASDAEFESYARRSIANIAVEKLVPTAKERDTESLDELQTKRSVASAEPEDSPALLWEKAFLALAPLVQEHRARLRKPDRKDFVEVWAELEERLRGGKDMREVLEARRLATPGMPAKAFHKVRQARFMRHIRARDAVGRTLASMLGEGRIASDETAMLEAILKALIRSKKGNK
jgi:hypothetical protein